MTRSGQLVIVALGQRCKVEVADYPILYVDDEQDNLSTFELNFGDDFNVVTALGPEEALKVLEGRTFAVIVADQRMPGMTGLQLLARGALQQSPPVGVLLTAYREVDVLAEAVNSGTVWRYIQKPWDRRELVTSLRQAIEVFVLRDQNRRLLERLTELNRYLSSEVNQEFNSGELVGRSAKLRAALEVVEKVAPTQSTVLITGQSGTGKELVARAIHRLSSRAQQPFVRVNLASLSPTIIESELFGHEKGSFTGALARKQGRFELASSGTLFLDEIGELPPELQVKLLRVLQEREFERVGGAETVKVDIRLLCATNRNLEELIRQGRFREDLYYRVNVFPVNLPPLKDRKDDIPLLAEHFLSKFAPRVGRAFAGFTPEALTVLLQYDWPGNVRELENVVERAMIVSHGPEITAADMAFLAPAEAEVERIDGLPGFLEGLEKSQLAEALKRCNGSVTQASKELGINRTTLYYRLKKYGLTA